MTEEWERNMDWLEDLLALGVYPDAVKWASQFSTLQAAWEASERGDSMLWFAGRVAGGEPNSPERLKLILATCDCARLALGHVPAGKEFPRQATSATENLATGTATLAQLKAATRAAWPCGATGAVWDDWATETVWSAGASWVAWATGATWFTGAARATVLRQCADIVRRHYPEAPTGCGR